MMAVALSHPCLSLSPAVSNPCSQAVWSTAGPSLHSFLLPAGADPEEDDHILVIQRTGKTVSVLLVVALWSTVGWGLLLNPCYQMWCAWNWSEWADQALVSCNFWIVSGNSRAVTLFCSFYKLAAFPAQYGQFNGIIQVTCGSSLLQGSWQDS